MCGIVGYLGRKDVESVLIVGLEKLEYRGYDSAGLAVSDNGEITYRKARGKIAELQHLLKSQKLNGTVGIGHTRWATHGEPSTRNAHPHLNAEANIAVVHNGTIDNYAELRSELMSRGFVFQSDTDTEVVPHLIASYNRDGLNIAESFRASLQRLEGRFAIAMIAEKEADSVFFVRNGAPLILAHGKESDEMMLASDVAAVVAIAADICYLPDGVWGYFRKSGEVAAFDLNGNPVPLEFSEMNLAAEDVEKGEFPHFMLKEIYEQPDIFSRILSERISGGRVVFPELQLSNKYLNSIGRIIIQACGTSLNAGLVGKLYFEQLCKINTDADFSSEFRYRNPVAGGDTLVIGISQSGETADTLAGLHEAKAKFLRVLSFLNNTRSTMARESDAFIDLMAKPEIGVASTKAYTAELLTLLLFALYLADLKWQLPPAEAGAVMDELQQLPDLARRVLQNVGPVQVIANFLKESPDAVFLGRTYNYPTALEGALKLKEISYIHASGYAGGEFKHGPIALVSEGTPVIVVVPRSEIRTKMLSNLEEVKARKGTIIAVITEGDEEAKSRADYVLEIPAVSELLSPILAVLPLQLLAYYTAVYRDCDVDKPRNLAKSVTVE